MPSTTAAAHIRTYKPGDERAQVEIYNAATAGLPGFKPATAEEVARRYRASDFEPESKLYAEADGRVVGYISFSPNARISVPWCFPEGTCFSGQLLEEAVAAMRRRGLRRAWAAYRADWTEVRRLLESSGFRIAYEMINFVAARDMLPRDSTPPYSIEPLRREDLPEVYALDPAAFRVSAPDELTAAWWDGPYLSGDCLFCLRDDSTRRMVAAGMAVIHPQYADPTKIDSAMPCFRLGAVGTEGERTKRVNGLFSYVARPGADNHRFAGILLGEACRRFQQAELAQVAAQCRSDRPLELAFYDRHFQRQKGFPIYGRNL